jgi:hypothetical protein
MASNDTRDNNKKYASKLPNRKYGYFRDDQITFLVTNDEEISEKHLRGFAKEITGKPKSLRGVRINKDYLPKAVPFPKFTKQEIAQSHVLLSPDMKLEHNQDLPSIDELEKSKGRFSMIECDLEYVPDDPSELLDIVDELNQQFQPDKKSFEGLTLQGTSLNWLTSVASNGSGTGGPGGRPSPYYGSQKNAPYRFDIIRQLEESNGGTIYGDGSGVDVVILDTAPSAQALVSAHKEWPDHPIISTLLGPNGKLHLYPATYDELLRLGSTSLNDHDYKMTDHGLFIAGIIHSIVPQADIHLVEVLNQYGVGDFTSFIRGLRTVRRVINKPERKLVINCSWMLEFPLDDNHCRHMGQLGDPDAEFERKVREFSKTDKSTSHALEVLFSQFFGLGKQAIAAAGNDARTGDIERTKARYPAALKSVKGVGALPKSLEQNSNGKYRSSVFSNLSESPDNRGIVTRGVSTLGGEEGEGNGVLGLYIGEFPDGRRNESKWAWWSGTSFATPILTGAVASVLSRVGNNVNTTQEAIAKLYAPGAKIILDGRAGKQEDALPVTQS